MIITNLKLVFFIIFIYYFTTLCFFSANEEKEKLDNEYAESFRAELKERVSQIVDMGFEYGEVKKVMENTLYDSELAVKILLKHVCI